MSPSPFPALTSPEVVASRSILAPGWKADLSDLRALDLRPALLELIRRTTSRLPQDVVEALVRGRDAEEPGSRAAHTLDTMLENVVLADARVTPLCQDTGTVLCWVRHPYGASQRALTSQLREAVAEATARSWLRPNCVAALSGRNPGDNLDPAGGSHPVIHFEEWDRPEVEASILLKGGGSENVGAQYRLPDAALRAGRDLEGVRRCVVDAVVRAQGQGCAPGILGVCIGGDRVVGLEHSKELLLRRVDSVNPDPGLAAMEARLRAELNTLGIGPMGYGGRTTVLAVHLGELWRHPASFFVSISYMCWSSRRTTLRIGADGTAVFE